MQNKTIADSLYPLQTKILREELMELERASILRNECCELEIRELRERILSAHKRFLRNSVLALSAVMLALFFVLCLCYISI